MKELLRRGLDAVLGARRAADADPEDFFWSLDAPALDAFDPAAPQRFRGILIHTRGRTAVGLRARAGDLDLGRCGVDVDRPDLAPFLPVLPIGSRCGWELELPPPPARTDAISFDAILDDGSAERLFDYDLARARGAREVRASVAERLATLPVPPPDLVALTQGIRDPEAYRASILPGVLNLRRYLAASGADAARFRAVLDFGCGSGRLLAGWQLLEPGLALHGCDLHPDLVAWASASFPPGVELVRNGIAPPLPWEAGRFDFAWAASVFTHLSVPSQRAWQAELHRVLAPGGLLLVTLHGGLYVRFLFGEGSARHEAFVREGHLELGDTGEGSNSCSSFHGPAFAERVFDRFRLLGRFPAGRVEGRRTLFPVASLQDVYVFAAR